MNPSNPSAPMSLRAHDAARQQAWKDHHAEFECEHPTTKVRKRRVAGGAWQLVWQCLDCGARVGNALPQAGIDMSGVMEFEQALADEYVARRDAAAGRISERFDRSKWFASYDRYLASPEWGKRRRQVLARAKGSCEGCGEHPPTEVHHLTYEHVGHEFLFELVALCEACHQRIHADDGDA